MYSFIELLRALAALLITNSHFDGVYPWNISWGGCPGVSLFFMISGFLLVKGVRNSDSFIHWWFNKIMRLYIPLTIVNLLTVVIGYRQASFMLFLFPISINLWYVPAIAMLYVFYYFALNKWGGGYRKQILEGLGIIYIVAYALRYRDTFFVEPEIWFRLLYGAAALVIGSLIYDKKDNDCIKDFRLRWFALGLCSCGGFLFVKLFMSKFLFLMRVQFITQILSVLFAGFLLMAGIGYEPEIKKLMQTKIGNSISHISRCSLEIYLVQFAIIGRFKEMPFPVNFILIIAAIMVVAEVVYYISCGLINKVKLNFKGQNI